MSWSLQSDPFYRWLISEANGLLWDVREDCFAQAGLEPDGLAEQGEAVLALLYRAASRKLGGPVSE